MLGMSGKQDAWPTTKLKNSAAGTSRGGSRSERMHATEPAFPRCHQYSSRLRDTLLVYQGLTGVIMLHVQTSKHPLGRRLGVGPWADGASGTTGALHPTESQCG